MVVSHTTEWTKVYLKRSKAVHRCSLPEISMAGTPTNQRTVFPLRVGAAYAMICRHVTVVIADRAEANALARDRPFAEGVTPTIFITGGRPGE
jgi:hypothetical protein